MAMTHGHRALRQKIFRALCEQTLHEARWHWQALPSIQTPIYQHLSRRSVRDLAYGRAWGPQHIATEKLERCVPSRQRSLSPFCTRKCG